MVERLVDGCGLLLLGQLLRRALRSHLLGFASNTRIATICSPGAVIRSIFVVSVVSQDAPLANGGMNDADCDEPSLTALFCPIKLLRLMMLQITHSSCRCDDFTFKQREYAAIKARRRDSQQSEFAFEALAFRNCGDPLTADGQWQKKSS